MRFLFFILVAVLTFSPVQVFAWGYDGHRIVCAIAWDQLKPAERAWVSYILQAAGKDAFVESCLWADEVRIWRKDTAPHHYINVPRGAERYEPARDCAVNIGCVAGEVLNSANEMRRTYSSDGLRFLAHYAGDMHQPLHAGFADDLGGNNLKGKFMGRDTNMHGLWDYGLLEATGRPWREIADDLSAHITQADKWAWSAGTPADWMRGTLDLSHSLAVGYGTQYTPASPPFELGQDYLNANLPMVYLQLEKAGTRLAGLLSNFLQDLPPAPPL